MLESKDANELIDADDVSWSEYSSNYFRGPIETVISHNLFQNQKKNATFIGIDHRFGLMKYWKEGLITCCDVGPCWPDLEQKNESILENIDLSEMPLNSERHHFHVIALWKVRISTTFTSLI